MATERIDIVITENGSRVVKKNLEDIGTSAEETTTAVDLLKGALATLGAAALVKEALDFANAATELQNRLRSTGLEGSNLQNVYERLRQVSNDTRQSFEGSVELYARLAVSSKELGTSQDDLIQFTKSLNQAIALSGASAEEAKNGIVQLAQGMASGRLQGQDLRSVMEQLPIVADVIASSMGKTRGQIKTMGEQGLITSQQVIKAFREAKDDLDSKFGKLFPTLAQSIIVFKNELTANIGELDKTTGATKTLAEAITYLANNLRTIIEVLTTFAKVATTAGAAYAALFVGQKAQAIVTAVEGWLAYRQAIASGTVVVLGSAEAERQKAVYLAESAAAEKAAAQAALDAAAAEEVKAAARLESVKATQASIAAEREAAVANLQNSNKGAAGAVRAAVQASPAVQSATAAAEAASAVEQKAAARLADVQATQAAIVAERELATLDLATAPTEETRRSAIEALVAARKDEQAILPLVAKEEQALAEASAAAQAAQEALNTAAAAANDAGRVSAINELVEARKAEEAITVQVRGEEWALAEAQVAAQEATEGLALASKASAEASAVASTASAAAAGSTSLLGGAVTAVKGMIQGLWALIVANPITALIAAVLAAVAAIYIWRDSIKLGTDNLTTLGDVFRVLWERIKTGFEIALQAVKNFFAPINKWFDETFGKFDFSLAGIFRAMAKYIDFGINMWTMFFRVLKVYWTEFPATVGDGLVNALNFLTGLVSQAVEKMVEEVNGLLKLLHRAPLEIPKLDLQIKNPWEGKATQFAEDLKAAFIEPFKQKTVEDWVNGVINDAQKIAKQRAGLEGPPVPPKPPGPPHPPEDEKALAKLQRQLNELVKEYDRVGEAKLKQTQGEKILDQAEEKHLITVDRHKQLLEQMTEHLEDMADPYGAMIRKIDDERSYLALSAEQQEIEAKVRADRLTLIKEGLPHGDKEIAQLREHYKLLQDETKVATARRDVIQTVTGTQKALVTQLEGMNAAVRDGSITQQQATDVLVNQQQDLFAGSIEQQRAWVDAMQQTYRQIDAMRQADFISEQTATMMKARLQAELYEKQLQGASQVFSQLSTLSRSKNKELAAIGKAAAVAQATMDGILAVQKAWAQGGAFGGILAAATGVATAANVASIMATDLGFQTGGSFVVGGTGPADSQLVSFRATPGEKVSVARPEQVRKGDPNVDQGKGGGNNVRIINVIDPKMVGDYMATPEGEEVFLNLIQRNGDAIRSVVK